MKSRWLLALLLVIILAGAQAPARAQTLPPVAGGIRLLEAQSSGLVLELTAPISALDQSLDAFARDGQIQKDIVRENDSSDVRDEIILQNSTRASIRSGGFVSPNYSVLVGLPPNGRAELRVLQDETSGVGDVRLETLYATAPEVKQSGVSARLVDEGWVRDRRVARLEFSPLQFGVDGGNPVWHSQIRVEIRFSEPDAAGVSDPAGSGSDNEILSQLINAEQARNWRVSLAASGAIRDPFADAPNTPLGPRYKLSVSQDGLYRVNLADLQAANPGQTAITPVKLHLYCQGQAVAMYVHGEEDGSFDAGDYILFYGQKFRGDRLAARHPEESGYYTTFDNGWHPQYSATQVEKYTDENVYWLVVGTTDGPRVGALPSVPGAAPVASLYRETRRAEQSNAWWTWHFTSEDTWFWERIRDNNDHSYTISLTNPAPTGGPLQVSGEIVGRTQNRVANPDHHTRVLFNNQVVENTTWDGLTRHPFSQSLPQSVVINGTNTLKVTAFFDAYAGQTRDDLCFDWFAVSYDRLFVAESDQITFGVNPVSSQGYQISGFTSPGVEAWDITQPLQPVRLTGATLSGGKLAFESNLTGSLRYTAAGSSAWKTPAKVAYYNPPDLLSSSLGADYIIITHPAFMAGVQDLAAFRADHLQNGLGKDLRVKVINFYDLVNQFNDGIYNPIAIKNFLSYTFLHWQAPAPAYVLLVGDGHWNFKGNGVATYGNPPIYMPPNLAWVDAPGISIAPDQGELDSANLLVNIVGTDPLPDLAVGRLPVNNDSELSAAINKIIGYENGPKNQLWQYRTLFVADNPDPNAGNFDQISDALVNDYMLAPYQAVKAYLHLTGGSGDNTLIANQITAIMNGFNSGALLVSYVGHGAAEGWSKSNFFMTSHVASLSNSGNLPVVLSLTCTDGYWLHPYPGGTSNFPEALAEVLVRAPAQGAVATFSPTGWGYSAEHDVLERGFLTALLKDRVTNLGALTTAARLSAYNSGTGQDMLHQYTLFGDPALKLKLPDIPTAVTLTKFDAISSLPSNLMFAALLALAGIGMLLISQRWRK
jgi:hypothetical protein